MQNRRLTYRAFGPPAEQLVLETEPLALLATDKMRVKMLAVPINPSDLIPITGAYSHRITPPVIAGYEGVGRVISAPPSHAHLIGHRVLPLRCGGTWQTFVDCDPELAVPVPDDIDDLMACRAYINPLAALTTLDRWPVVGKHVVLSGAGSMCSELLGKWAREQGVASVVGLYRSEARRERLIAAGIDPVSTEDIDAVKGAASEADLVFDALGGQIGNLVLSEMPGGTAFVAYGLLSGHSIRTAREDVRYHRFHLRDSLAVMTPDIWQSQFVRLWESLRSADLPPVSLHALHDWRHALQQIEAPGAAKAVLTFD